MAICFNQLGDQSSSLVPDGRAFFDRVSKAAASARARSLTQQLFFKCTTLLALSYQLRPVSWMASQHPCSQKASFQASSCSGYSPLLPTIGRAFRLHSWAPVWMTACQFGTGIQRSGLEGLAGTNKSSGLKLLFPSIQRWLRNAGLPAQLGNTLIRGRHHLLDGLFFEFWTVTWHCITPSAPSNINGKRADTSIVTEGERARC